MKVLFITNLPSPYRVDFFNELGKSCELTVCFERKSSTERDEKWQGCGAGNFNEIYADVKLSGVDESRGNGIVKVIKKESFDKLIISGYASPSVIRAITYCRRRHIEYYIESDGGFCKKDSFPKNLLKKFLLCGAVAHFTTCDEHIKYLKSLGVKRVYKYPFSSVKEDELLKVQLPDASEKRELKQRLGIREENTVLTVGRFTYNGGYGKGYDSLMKAAKSLKDVGFYIVGGEPTEEFIKIKNDNDLSNVHFVGFKTKAELSEYYKAADVFALLTRGDVWGLVINEAMMYSLPVITTPLCNAGLELVRPGENGFITHPDDIDEIVKNISFILKNDEIKKSFGRKSREIIQSHTVEAMAKAHIDVLRGDE